MTHDAINDEIRTIRRKLATDCGNDVSVILEDVRQREIADGRRYLVLPRRRQQVLDEQSDVPKLQVARDVDGSSTPATG